MAISTITSAGIADNAVTAAKMVAGAVVADVGTDGITANEIVAGAVGSSEIAADAVTAAKIAYLGDGSGNLTGTISSQQLYFADAFTLTGDLTVNDELVLGKIRDDGTGQTLTHTAATNRTLTGTGTITMGVYLT